MPQITIDEAMKRASEHHQAGEFADAERVYRQVLAQHPEHVDALHLLGVLAGQGGQPDAAINLIGKAVQLNPEYAEAYGNLAIALVQKGRFDEAIAAFQRLVQLRPADAGAYNGLALVLRNQGRIDEAIAAFTRAIQLRPDYAEAHTNLGILLRARGRLDEAITSHSKAVALRPDFTEAYINLGNALKEKGLADEASAAYARAEQLTRDLVAAHNKQGLSYSAQKRYDAAAQCHRRALQLMPDDVTAHDALGHVLLTMDAQAAADSFRRALALSPNLESSWNGLGAALRTLGKFEEASDCFRRAMEIAPGEAIHYTNLASTGRKVVDPAELQRLTDLVDQPGLGIQPRIAAGFALGKLLDDADRFDEAFSRYLQANLVVKRSREAEGEGFDGEALHRQVDRLIETFTPQFFAERREFGETSELPVFIVGMPRSGTTLTEQIAASHPQVFGAGELAEIANISEALGADEGRIPADGWNAVSIQYLARAHLERLQSLGGGASRVIDKMPANVFELGVISLLFPNARVIFCRRDARDNCLSCYFQWFTHANKFAYDLADCGRQYLETERLMAHWLRVLPLRMLEVQYEEVVADLEGKSRRLIDFLGLPWDPACLEFHKTQRAVMTSSLWQVRQPLYSSSVGRWRHYERHLKPLLDVLSADPGVLEKSPAGPK